jgi:hypothetical protein
MLDHDPDVPQPQPPPQLPDEWCHEADGGCHGMEVAPQELEGEGVGSQSVTAGAVQTGQDRSAGHTCDQLRTKYGPYMPMPDVDIQVASWSCCPAAKRHWATWQKCDKATTTCTP